LEESQRLREEQVKEVHLDYSIREERAHQEHQNILQEKESENKKNALL
jgi:hypothetical protein